MDFWTPPRFLKFMWGPFLHSFPGNEAHKLFSGGPKWDVLGGGQKVYVEKLYVGAMKVSTSTVAAPFSKMALTGQRIAMVDMVLLVFPAFPYLP